MKRNSKILISLLATAMAATLCGCTATIHVKEKAPDVSEEPVQTPDEETLNEEATDPMVECSTGKYIGTNNDGIFSFKGIRYAKPPVGELRWKAPEPIEKSTETFDATHFGKSAFQVKSDSEQASLNPEGMSEDCLTLNVWTSDPETKGKPVMFWIHGGAFSYGGTADPLYDGGCIVAEHPDVVVVSCNYRVGPMGFIDFSKVEGGDAFPTSGYNGILDQIEGLKWVQDNIEAFGGDPENVTIFGESAGGGSVAILLCSEGTEGLFRHAIAESGSVNFTMTHERFEEIGAAAALMDKANAKNMDDLMAISEEDLYDLYIDDSDGKSVATMSVLPLRGKDSIIPEDPYQAILDGAGKDVDLIIGTTADECRYFADSMFDPSCSAVEGEEREKMTETKLDLYSKTLVGSKLERVINMCNDEEKANLDEFLKLYDKEEEIWQKTELVNEYGFRSPAIKVAYNHASAGGTGKTYMYYFCKKNTLIDWIGACHACELAYVFHNFGDEQFSGPVLPELADAVCSAWTNFATVGDPNGDLVNWPEYSPENRETIFFNDDGTTSIVNDPKSKERELIDSILHYYVAL